MKRLGWKTVLVIILAALVFLWIVKATVVSSYLTNKLQIPISISRISLGPKQTVIRNFKIKNPRGFKAKTALLADRTTVDYAFKELVSKPSKIEKILIQDVYLSVEFTNPLGTQNNWTRIGANMPKEKSKKKGRGVVIRQLIIENLTADIRGLGLIGKPQTRRINRIELNNINSEEGFPTKQLISQIFQGAGLEKFIKDAFNPANLIQDALNPFRLFGENTTEKKRPPQGEASCYRENRGF